MSQCVVLTFAEQGRPPGTAGWVPARYGVKTASRPHPGLTVEVMSPVSRPEEQVVRAEN